MLGRTALVSLAIAAAAAGLVTPSAAEAQCRLCGTPTTTREEPEVAGEIKLEVETSLNFDRLILANEGEGSATLRPDGSGTTGGSVADMSPRTVVGTVTLRGEPGRAVRIDIPPRIQLYSLSGGSISFDDVTSDLPSLPRLDAAGRLTFRFGGRLRISGDAEGDYRGELPITAEYL
jgi:hypothetical protein